MTAHSLPEWIGIGAAIVLALSLISGLTWINGSSHGVERRRLRAAIIQLWVGVIVCTAGLAYARYLLGGGVMDYDSRGDSPIAVRALGPREMVVIVAAVAWVAGWTFVVSRAVRGVTPTDPTGADRPS
ncbi:MAG: hypothetical protein HPY44_04650 [Armatimonadetes bacterium]|nr:hypothetical protein [Armatimonadota bacterium]